MGDYDLEVETLNLEAETINRQVVKVGKSPNSVFGEDSILETIRANVLKKPFKKDELVLMINQALEDKTASEVHDQMKQDFETFMKHKMNQDIASANSRMEELIANIPNEKKIQKAENSKQAINIRTAEIKAATQKKLQKANSDHHLIHGNLSRLIDFFTIGKVINYPWKNYEGNKENIPGVCLGIHIDAKRNNPYAPSAIKIKFALASSLKYISLTAGPKFMQQLSAIQGESYHIREWQAKQTMENWNDIIAKSSVDRNVRHMITGNLLQAYSDYRGNLVSYTTIDGAVKKGILMSEAWIPKQGGESIQVPIGKAARFVKSLTAGTPIFTSGNLGIMRQYDVFKIIVPASKVKGGKFFLDNDILALVHNRRFEKISDRMIAAMDEDKMDELIQVLQNNHSASVELTQDQYVQIANTLEKPVPKKVMVMPKKKEDDEEVLILEMEAEALSLELELLQVA